MKLVAVLNGVEVPVDVVKSSGVYRLTIDGKTFTVDAICPTPLSMSLLIGGKSHEVGLEKNGNRYSIYFYDDTVELDLYEARKFRATEIAKKSAPTGPLKIVAPMPGKIVKVIVKENESVLEGDPLLVIEAMKMQNELKAARAGVVRQLHVKEGEAVASSQALLILE